MTTENSSQETVQTTAPESSGDTSSSSSQASSSPESTPTEGSAPAYQPNYKFKAYNKEYEIEEPFRPFIKDPDLEGKFRKLHEKAYGFDPLKEKHDGLRQEYDTYKSKYEPIDRSLTTLGMLLENKDYETFFQKLNIPHDDLFKWADKKLKELDLPPDQRAEIDRQRQDRERLYYLDTQNQQLMQNYQSTASQARQLQLDNLLSRQDVSKYASDWDSKMGEIGAFRKLVIREAEAEFRRSNRDLSVEEAIQHVVSNFGKLLTPQEQAAAQQQEMSPEAMTMQAPQEFANGKRPIIPHVPGKGTSPVKKAPRSIADLKAMAKNL